MPDLFWSGYEYLDMKLQENVVSSYVRMNIIRIGGGGVITFAARQIDNPRVLYPPSMSIHPWPSG